MGINCTWRPWFDLLYACDGKWWNAEGPSYGQDALRNFPGEIWTQDEQARDLYGVRWVRSSTPGRGLSLDPGLIHTGGNSGYQAINLAALMGATDIALLGYDMQRTNGRSHHHGDHVRVESGPALTNPDEPTFRRWREGFAELAEDCERYGVRVVNCSRATALDCFERMTIEEWLHAPQRIPSL